MPINAEINFRDILIKIDGLVMVYTTWKQKAS